MTYEIEVKFYLEEDQANKLAAKLRAELGAPIGSGFRNDDGRMDMRWLRSGPEPAVTLQRRIMKICSRYRGWWRVSIGPDRPVP